MRDGDYAKRGEIMTDNLLSTMTSTDIGIIFAIVIGLIACVLCSACLVVLLKKKGASGVSLEEVKSENAILQSKLQEVDLHVNMVRDMTIGAVNTTLNSMQTSMIASNQDVANRLDNVSNAIATRLDTLKSEQYKNFNELKDGLTQSMQEMKKDNATQLEKMREVVDEKLSSTLEKRFDASFKIVNARLEEINRTFGELQGLQSSVSDLNKIFKNVKTRGTWGEVSLESLLDQILSPEQFEKQYRIKKGSLDLVDFVIKMPGKGDGEVLLPIDAKFPIDDYIRLCEASDNGDLKGIEDARKALKDRVMSEARSIRDKYISVPKTTNFAILYLPTESLYAEVLRIDGLAEELQVRHRIMVCGPTTIAALLNSLQMGFRSVAAEKHSADIVKLFKDFVSDFDKFTELLQKTSSHLGTVQNTISSAEKRTEIIKKKLDKVSRFDDTIDAGIDVPQIASDIESYD